jgi:hypothetical protein
LGRDNSLSVSEAIQPQAQQQWRTTMHTTKTLILTARVVSALALGSGSAIAQDGPGSYFPDYQAAKILAADKGHAGELQMGSPDVDATHNGFQLGPFHATPDHGIATVGGDGTGG